MHLVSFVSMRQYNLEVEINSAPVKTLVSLIILSIHTGAEACTFYACLVLLF